MRKILDKPGMAPGANKRRRSLAELLEPLEELVAHSPDNPGARFESGGEPCESGKDLNREFWCNSAEPEVRLLQAEFVSRSFEGIAALHTDNTAEGSYGFARGATLTRHLIEPASKAAEFLLPRGRGPLIDGFHAGEGVIRDGYEGILSAPKSTTSSFRTHAGSVQGRAFLRETDFALALPTPKTCKSKKNENPIH